MSLRAYLRSRLLLLGVAVSLPIIYLVFSLYELGLDDATEGYLKEDIKYAIYQLNKTGVLPESTDLRLYYLGLDALPEQLKAPINNQRYYPYYIWQSDQAIYYGISELYEGERLYVFHQFAVEEAISGIQLETIVLIFVCLVLFLMVIGAGFIYRRISKSMTYLNVISHDPEALHSSDYQTEFTEIQDIAQALKVSIVDLQRKNTHERYFIQSLSHELRTPMAIIQVAVELLKKQSEFSEDIRIHEKLTTIFDANLKMQSLANHLLGLWSHTQQQEKLQVNLNHVIEQCVEELGHQHDLSGRLNLLLPNQEVVVEAPLFAVQLVFINVIKNAIIHGEGVIEITLTNTHFTITNHIAYSNNKVNDSVGMGLFIVEQGIECLGWQWQTSNEESYRVAIDISE